jgi:hypothetical protein
MPVHCLAYLVNANTGDLTRAVSHSIIDGSLCISPSTYLGIPLLRWHVWGLDRVGRHD